MNGIKYLFFERCGVDISIPSGGLLITAQANASLPHPAPPKAAAAVSQNMKVFLKMPILFLNQINFYDVFGKIAEIPHSASPNDISVLYFFQIANCICVNCKLH